MKDNQKYRVVINGCEIQFKDPIPNGEQILSAANLDPADEHVLVQILHHESRSIGLNEPVELRKDSIEVFKAFHSDRVFKFTINGRGYDWGFATISEAELREIAGIEDELVLIRQQEGIDHELNQGDYLDLSEHGTEHLLTSTRLVTVYLDGEPKSLARGAYTTEQLLQALKVEDGYRLNILKNGKLELLEPGEKVHVREGQHFISQVPCGGAS